jgi:hypothetical protein
MSATNPPQSDPAAEAFSRALQGADAEAYLLSLPPIERRVATLAREGRPIWEIAHDVAMSDEAVARIIDDVIAAVAGNGRQRVETGGLGSDTDPGVTGGYGDTGFGALDTEPIPNNVEPTNETGD